jgi:hypothetical protein
MGTAAEKLNIVAPTARIKVGSLAEAAGLSHSVECSPQHATAAKCRLRPTAGWTRFDDRATSAETLGLRSAHLKLTF